MTTISIIGSGNMAAAIGTRALKHGHTAELISRSPAKAQALAERLGNGAAVGSPAQGRRATSSSWPSAMRAGRTHGIGAVGLGHVRADGGDAREVRPLGDLADAVALRQAAEPGQVELARRLGVTQAAISRIEQPHDLLLSASIPIDLGRCM